MPIWFSIWAPVGTSQEIIETLNRKMVEIPKTPEMVQRLREISFMPAIASTEELATFLDQRLGRKRVVIREAKITLS